MRPYSLDLRQKVVDAIDNSLGTNSEIAEMFNVSESFIYNLLRRRRETGDITPAPHGGGAQLKLDDATLEALAEIVDESPDATLEQLRDLLEKETKVSVCVSSIWNGLEYLGITLKKKRAVPMKPTPNNALPSRKNSPN